MQICEGIHKFERSKLCKVGNFVRQIYFADGIATLHLHCDARMMVVCVNAINRRHAERVIRKDTKLQSKSCLTLSGCGGIGRHASLRS
jgi:hypothetical protein